MGLIPTKRTDKVAFFNSKVAPWTTNATAIGTTTSAVTAMGTKVTAAQAALAMQFAAEQAFKTATAAADHAIDALVVAGSDIIKSIRAKAATGGNAVYELAEIPGPATPSPVNTLGQPCNIKAELGQDGSVTIAWKCVSPRASGVVYQVFRRLDGEAEFTYIGGTGTKRFVDANLPAGAASAMYKLQAIRSTASGPWATFTVMFGTGAGGQQAATVTQSAPKMAA